MANIFHAMLDREYITGRLRAARCPDGGDGVDGRVIDTLTPAAVLVPLIQRAEGFNVLLTRRADQLRDHAGQISFPGGRIDPEDPSPEDAALREAEEEIGLPRSQVELIGRLGRYATGTGYLVYPVVGVIEQPVLLTPEPAEVAEIFEVPLAFFLDPANHRPHVFEHRGRRHRLIAMPYGDYFIWGATAQMLRGLYQVLRGE
jgi:8-oxo-dGTP pyrophosphatase MutT (NUDIX family)